MLEKQESINILLLELTKGPNHEKKGFARFETNTISMQKYFWSQGQDMYVKKLISRLKFIIKY